MLEATEKLLLPSFEKIFGFPFVAKLDVIRELSPDPALYSVSDISLCFVQVRYAPLVPVKEKLALLEK